MIFTKKYDEMIFVLFFLFAISQCDFLNQRGNPYDPKSDNYSEIKTYPKTYPWSDFPAETLSNNLYSLWKLNTIGMDVAAAPFDGFCSSCGGASCISDISTIGYYYLHFDADGYFTAMMNLNMIFPITLKTNGWITCTSFGGIYTYNDGTKRILMISDAAGGQSDIYITGTNTGGLLSIVTKCAEVSTVSNPPEDSEIITEDCDTFYKIMDFNYIKSAEIR